MRTVLLTDITTSVLTVSWHNYNMFKYRGRNLTVSSSLFMLYKSYALLCVRTDQSMIDVTVRNRHSCHACEDNACKEARTALHQAKG